MHEKFTRTLPRQSNYSHTAEQERRQRPWTEEEYERVRQAAIALRKTHASWHLPNGDIRPSFDGSAYWALLGALDRTSNHGYSQDGE